ncbi:hypothetical protein HPP92_028637 [Vanilla planifolia]|uniref:Uncharacterized protein n=1 Tax=Vanilla planifolia TaxID=51239 RepID=A0A835P4P5_VANPL|nr:hypothetical protein HPP92_028637 [Vanilla planifolia]
MDHVLDAMDVLQRCIDTCVVDEFHPTEAVNKILADDVWSSKHANICSPMNMEEMVRQGMD